MALTAQELIGAGFTEDEIRSHIKGKLAEAGFNDAEIENHFAKTNMQGVTPEEVDSEVPANKNLWPGFVKPTLKAIPKVLGATLGSMAALPGAGIEAGARLLPRISTDPNKLIETGSLKEAEDVLNKRLGVFQNFITTPEEAQGAENLGLAMKPIEMAGRGWAGLAELGTTGDIEKAAQVVKGEPGSNIAAPIAGTIGEFSGMFLPISPKALKQLRTRIVNSDTWRSASIKERGLIIQDLDDLLRNPQNIKAGLTEADILRQYGGKYFDQGLKRRMAGETSSVFEDVMEKAPEKPPIETAAAGGVEQQVPEFMGKATERPVPAKIPPIEPTELKKVPEESRPIIGPEGQWVEGAGEVQRPYPGQQRLPGPIPLLPGPKPIPQPPTKPIPGPVGGSTAFFPEGAPINVPPQLQIAGPPGPIPMAEAPQVPKPDTLEADLLAEFSPKGMNPYIARQAAMQIRGGLFTIDDLRAKYAAKAPVPTPKAAVQGAPVSPTIAQQPPVEAQVPVEAGKGKELKISPKAMAEAMAEQKQKEQGAIYRAEQEGAKANAEQERQKKLEKEYVSKLPSPTLPEGVAPYAGSDGLDVISPKRGDIVWQTSSETGKLEALRYDGSTGKNFDGKPIGKWTWLTGVERGNKDEGYGRSFYKPTAPPEAQPAPLPVAKEGKPIPKEAHGWVRINNIKRPFTEFEEITRGKNKGKVRVIIKGRKFVVSREQVSQWPGEKAEKSKQPPDELPKATERGPGILSKIKEANANLGDTGAFSWQKKPKEGEGLLDAIKSLQPPGQPRALVSISELRDQANMPSEAFDKALMDLAKDGKVALHKHDSPFSLSEEARNKLLAEDFPGAYHEGKNYYVGVVPKEPTGGGILSKERGEVGGATFKKKGVTKEDIERTDTTPADLSTPKQIWETLKKGRIKLSKEDATILEQIARIPLWVGKAHKQYKPIQDVIDDRFRDYHIIRNGYVKELLDSWEGLSKESLDKIGEIHWKEDALGKVLSDKGKAKLTPEELRAVETNRAVLDFIWKDHLPDIYLQSRLGKRKWADLDEVEQEALKAEVREIIDAGYRPGYMPHPRPGRYFARASIPAKSEMRTKKGLPYKSEPQLKEALRMRGLKPEKYDLVEVEDGWIARSKTDDTFDTVWREHFDDVIATATGKGRKLGIPTISYKAPGIEKRLEKNFPEALIEIGENTKTFAEQGYFEVSPGVTRELIDSALKRMGPEATPEEIKRFGTALTESVNDIFKVRGFMEHSMKRKGIPGFDKENWQEAIVNYVTGFSGFASKAIASRKLWDAWPKSGLAELPGLRKYAEKQIHDTFSNMDRADETIAKVRALMFYDFLGGVVKSALIQPTSNYFNAVPRLTVDTNWATTKMTAEMARAAKDVLDALYSKATGGEVVPGLTRYQTEKAKRLSASEQMMLQELREDGTISTQLTDELMGKVPRETFLYGVPEKISKALRWMFGTLELYNREVTAVIAHRIAEGKGKTHAQAVDYTRDIINTTQGKYGRTNLPPFARGERGKWARMAYSFSFFPHNQLALYRDLGTNHGPRGKYGLMKAFMALMFLGGLGGIPFYKDLEQAAQFMTGKNLRSEIAKITGDWSKAIFYGVPGMMGVDITGSIGIGLPSQVIDLLGPPAQYYKRTTQFMNDVAIRDWQRAAEDFPLVFQAPRNIMSAYRNATRGVEKRSGKDVVDDDFEQVKLTPWEAGGKAIGFQPVTLSEVYRKDETRKGLTSWWNDKRDGIVTAAATHIDDEKQMERVGKLIEDFNSSKPDYIPPIKIDTIRKRVMPIRTKQERIRREQVK